jgi:hypothetical protein
MSLFFNIYLFFHTNKFLILFLRAQSVPFLESTERAPQPVSAPQRSTSPWSLVERPTPATTSADGAHQGQSDNATAEEAEVSGGGSDPWVTIDKQPVQSQQPSPRTAHASAAEVDKYIEEEFELTKLSAREYASQRGNRRACRWGGGGNADVRGGGGTAPG